MAGRVIEQIIMDWWNAVAPDGRLPASDRLAAYIELYTQIKDEGHARDDVLFIHKNDILNRSHHTKYRYKKRREAWKAMCEMDLEKAESHVFGVFQEVIPDEARQAAETIRKREKEREEAEPEDDSRPYVPDEDSPDKSFTMDYINENYSFDLDESVLRGLTEEDDE